jgi:hypothetical protein
MTPQFYRRFPPSTWHWKCLPCAPSSARPRSNKNNLHNNNKLGPEYKQTFPWKTSVITSRWSSDPDRMQVPLEFQQRVLTQPSCTARAFTCFIRCSSSLLSVRGTELLVILRHYSIVYKRTLAAVGEGHSVLDAPALGQVMQSVEEVFGRHLVFSAHGLCALHCPRPKMQQSEKKCGALH